MKPQHGDPRQEDAQLGAAEVTQLPVMQENWFRIRPINSVLDQIDEPHVDGLLRANIWHLRGRDRDLVVDSGLGAASLREHLPHLFERDPVLVLTHAHLDHMGGAHEFDCCWAHPGERFTDPPPGSLHRGRLCEELGITSADFDGPELLLDALPSRTYAIDDYQLRPAPDVRWLHDDARIDLGDCEFTVLHLPGHSPASLGLFDERNGTLFSGDVVYDDVLIDDCVGSNLEHYRTTMQRLVDLPVTVVHPGHGDGFGPVRLREIATAYLDRQTVNES